MPRLNLAFFNANMPFESKYDFLDQYKKNKEAFGSLYANMPFLDVYPGEPPAVNMFSISNFSQFGPIWGSVFFRNFRKSKIYELS